MADETAEIVRPVGLELVPRLAPEELPVYSSLVSQSQGATRGGGRKASSDDQLLGFGVAEAVTVLTPIILSFTSSFWQAFVAEAARSSAHGVVEYVKAHLQGRREFAGGPPLPLGRLQLVRTMAEREARQLDISASRAGLFADAMAGVLTAPPVS